MSESKFELIVVEIDPCPMYKRYLAIKDSMPPVWDAYTSRRGVANNDRVIREYHHAEMLPLVRRLIHSDAIKPSYCFLSRYEKGTALRAHTDRASCQWTLSHTLYADPLEFDNRWDLVVGGCRLGLRVGQAVLFRGTEFEHYRPPMPAILEEYINVYYHFVPVDYVGDLS